MKMFSTARAVNMLKSYYLLKPSYKEQQELPRISSEKKELLGRAADVHEKTSVCLLLESRLNASSFNTSTACSHFFRIMGQLSVDSKTK